ncbi:MAG: hypothetical protein EPO11_06595 [Gammaproteobacteria bacterium]|nr:MAG: hypothetical protein EPO11_06595 [Gammaproteobacteria bacterium]
MLRQEINLYRSFSPTSSGEVILTWRRFVLSQVFLIVMLFLLYFSSLWQLHSLKKTVVEKKNQLTALQSKFEKIKNTYPQLFFSQDITNVMSKLQEDLAAKQKILESVTNQSPFSQNLLALSRTIAANVWLTDILLAEGGYAITLKGKSIGMGNLQIFLDNLSHDKTFSGFNISANNIENTGKSADNTMLTFEIEMNKK